MLYSISMTRRIAFPIVLFIALCSFAFADAKVVSVLYFENTTANKDYAWFSKGAADMLSTDLAAQPELTVVEHEQIEKVLKEQEKSVSGLYDEKSAVRIGKLMAARQIIIGAFIVLKNNLRIDAKLVDVETGRLLKGFQASGDLDKLFAVQQNLAAGVLVALGVKADSGAARGGTESVEAAKAYYTGVDLLDAGAYDAAAKSFRQAVKLDPFYLKPQKSLEDAYRFLKDFRKQRFQRELAKLYEEAAQLKARLAAPKFQSYGEFVVESYNKGLTNEQIKKLTDANPTLMKGDTPAVCTWELQNTLHEIADQAEENFGDKETAVRMHNEVMLIAAQARVTFKDDVFLPEILYQEVLSLNYFEDWQKLMTACEYLMEHYADYRMMWAVEDFYARAIEKLGGKKADDDD
jgi:TolB-like protein